MPRSMPANLIAIFAAPSRKIEYLLDITFPSITTLRLSTGVLIKDLIDYENSVEKVAEIRQTIEQPVDRVNITLQNKSLFFDAHLSENFAEWEKAEAVLYRRYISGDGTLMQDVEVFSGAVQSLNLSDSEPYVLTFQIIPDTISKGLIVANRTLALACSFVFKDPATCAYSGPVLTCNHLLKSDCTRLLNSEHYGGTESRYTNKTNAPGSAGNPDTGGDPRLPNGCFLKGTRVNLTDKKSIEFSRLYLEREKYIGSPLKSFDDEGVPVTDFIVSVNRHIVYEYYLAKFSTDRNRMKVTGTQPFFTPSKEFKEFRQLRCGDAVVCDGGTFAELESIELVEVPEGIEVYSLATKFYHHYHANKKRVHNKIIGIDNQY